MPSTGHDCSRDGGRHGYVAEQEGDVGPGQGAETVLSALAPNLTTRDDGWFRLRHLQDSERSGGAAELKQTTAVGGDVLVMAGLEAEEVAELVVASTEPPR